MTPTIFSHPDRQPQRFRPFKAFQHFRKLIADKEDTEQVFHIFENLPRKGFMDDARAFVESDFGQKLMEREPYLPDLLDDMSWRPIVDLSKRYPELVFSWVAGKRPKGFAYTERTGKGYTCARWRTAEDPR